jgi:signal transduction histidine kinase
VTFPSKLFWMVTVLVLCAASLIAVGATIVVRRTLEEVEEEQSNTLSAQFRQEFGRRGEEVVVRVRGIADSETTLRMAIDLMGPNADPSLYVNDAHVLAVSQRLDFLDFVSTEGKIISSAEWPVRANSSMQWVLDSKDWSSRGSFLTRMDTEAGPELALMAISNVIPVADKRVYVVGGVRLGPDFLKSLEMPPGGRAMIYRNIDPAFTAANLIDSNGPVLDANHYAGIVTQELKQPIERRQHLNWTAEASQSKYEQLLPLQGRTGDLLGVFLIEEPEVRRVAAMHFIMYLGLEAVLVAFLFGWLVKSWTNMRVNEPVQELTAATQELNKGNYTARVDNVGDDEIGKLGREFNQMASRLKDHQDVAAQGERVSAWRELAGTFAAELGPTLKQFDGTIADLKGWGAEGTEMHHRGITDFAAVLGTQAERLRSTVNAFADFAKMPVPRLIAVDLNGLVQRVMRASESKFTAAGRPPVTPELKLAPELHLIHGDPQLLETAIANLVSSVIEAMPAGGPVVVKTKNITQGVRLVVSNHGAGISSEEWRRFAPTAETSMCASNGYFDPLSLAIVQAVVSDHHGSLMIEDEAGVGTKYRIELPEDPRTQHAGELSAAAAATAEEEAGAAVGAVSASSGTASKSAAGSKTTESKAAGSKAVGSKVDEQVATRVNPDAPPSPTSAAKASTNGDKSAQSGAGNSPDPGAAGKSGGRGSDGKEPGVAPSRPAPAVVRRTFDV